MLEQAACYWSPPGAHPPIWCPVWLRVFNPSTTLFTFKSPSRTMYGQSNVVLLGSEYLRNPPDTPKHLPDLSPGLCMDLSALKSLLHKYRKLDDAISTRMNRAREGSL